MEQKTKRDEEYFGTNWTPPGYTKKEWQEVWQKLWTLSREELCCLAKKLGTKFVNPETQKTASKSDFLLLIDDGVKKKDLLQELEKLMTKKRKDAF